MAVSINNTPPVVVQPQSQSNKPAFKGTFKTTEQGNPYYHTNSAMKIGGTLAGVTVLSTIINYFSGDIMKKSSGIIKDVIKPTDAKFMETAGKHMKQAALVAGAIGIASHLLSAAFIDNKRNKQTKLTADLVRQNGAQQVLMNNSNVQISNRGRVQHESVEGAKYGAILGAVCGLASGGTELFMNNKFAKKTKTYLDGVIKEVGKDMPKDFMKNAKKLEKTGNIAGLIVGVGINALGGWLLGKWSDNIANKDIRRHA